MEWKEDSKEEQASGSNPEEGIGVVCLEKDRRGERSRIKDISIDREENLLTGAVEGLVVEEGGEEGGEGATEGGRGVISTTELEAPSEELFNGSDCSPSSLCRSRTFEGSTYGMEGSKIPRLFSSAVANGKDVENE